MEIQTLLNLLISYNLTADELLVIYLTLLARDEEGHPELFAKGFSNGGSTKLRDIFESLKRKGIILKDYNPDTYDPNDIQFNKTFLKSGFKNSGWMGEELFEAYPAFLETPQKGYPLKNIAKKYNTLDEFYFAYSSAIKHNVEKHKEVLELLDWGKKNNHITYNICEFIISHKGEELKYLRDNGIENDIAFSTLLDD